MGARKKAGADVSPSIYPGPENALYRSGIDPSDDNLPASIESATLTGDLRDLILGTLRHEQDKRPWHERSEADQIATVDRVDAAVHEWVRQAVELIAADGRPVIKAVLAKVTIKDGVKAELTMSQHDDLRHALFDAQGKAVLLVVADPDEYEGERAPPVIQKDQPDLPMAEHSVID